MTSENKFGMLRRLLRTLGLSQQAADDVVNFIVDLLAGERKDGAGKGPEFPYHLRDRFLSPAELNFYGVLNAAVDEQTTICVKVGLNDLFYVKKDDPSRYRIYTNKIDRKHVDFLLCDPGTMRPLAGIELDDKSHQRQDRQERDAFVDQVFQTAGLPLLHIPVKRAYVVTELAAQVAPYLCGVSEQAAMPIQQTPHPAVDEAPRCPTCGGEMVLRTAKRGANAGHRFWGCSNYPECRSMLPYNE